LPLTSKDFLSDTEKTPLIMLQNILIAGMHWKTTTKAQKPVKRRISGLFVMTLLVALEDASAEVLVMRLTTIVLPTAAKILFVFMATPLFIYTVFAEWLVS